MSDMRSEMLSTIVNIVDDIKEKFNARISGVLKVSRLGEIDKSLFDAVERRKTVTELINDATETLKTSKEEFHRARKNYRADIRATMWANWRWCAIAMMAVIFSSWVFFNHQYSAKLSVQREIIFTHIEENRAVLAELAKYGRRMEMSFSDKGNRVFLIRNAEGWTSTDKHGAIEIRK